MPLNPAQIKDKLTNALDDNKNVVDERALEEVISLLETSTLTKEILEQTRLGREINVVRKTCKNPGLAKRARNLVKAWQKLISAPGSPQVVNGQHSSLSLAHQRISPGLQRVSPGLSPAISRSSTPLRSGQSPALAQARSQYQKLAGYRSPAVQSAAKPVQKSAKSPAVVRNASQNNDDSNLSWPSTSPCPSNENSQDRLGGDSRPDPSDDTKNSVNKPYFNFDHKSSDHSLKSTSKSVNRASDQRDVSKTNVANRKRTRAETKLDGADLQLPPSKHRRNLSPGLSVNNFSKTDVINGSLCKISKNPPVASTPENLKLAVQRQDSASSRLSVQSADMRSTRDRTSKVKTTEQLIEDMQCKSATPVVDTKVIAQIRTNMIQKESSSQKATPQTGGKKRGRKRKGSLEQLELPDKETASDGRKLAQTKSEYIERFLKESIAPTPGEDIYDAPITHSRQECLEEQPIGLGGCSATFSQTNYDSSFPSYPTRQDKSDSGPSASPPEARDLLEGVAHHLPTTSSEHLTEGQILARLPPIDFSNIDWTSHDYSSPQPVQVGDDLVERLHRENMDSINGNYDRDGQFRRWAEMLTVDSVDDPLYILPYVILE